MNILFLSILDIPQGAMKAPGLYIDLLREFKHQGHDVYVACGHEKRTGKLENLVGIDEGIHVLHVPIGDVTKTQYFKKGINTVLLPRLFTKAVKEHFGKIKIDLILYATPPVTLCSTVKSLKNQYGAKTYLLLKDMWPEGISSLGVIKRGGILYRFFEHKEKSMYKVSDYIGTMSDACSKYLFEHHPEIPKNKIMVCPNSMAPLDLSLAEDEKIAVRSAHNIPADKVLIAYGGNLGRAQGVDFLIENLKRNAENNQIHFVIVGSGLEYPKLKTFVDEYHPQNVTLMKAMPRKEYNEVMAACDVGMILLNYKLTVPNTPSRTLDYMQAKLPVLGCVDSVTDMGDIIEKGHFGWKCLSNDHERFNKILQYIVANRNELREIGENGYNYFLSHYTSEHTYKIIVEAIGQ